MCHTGGKLGASGGPDSMATLTLLPEESALLGPTVLLFLLLNTCRRTSCVASKTMAADAQRPSARLCMTDGSKERQEQQGCDGSRVFAAGVCVPQGLAQQGL